MPISYTEISKPSTPTYSEVEPVAQNFLLINSEDFLLINASGDRLLINQTRDIGYTEITKPSAPTYTTLAKPS